MVTDREKARVTTNRSMKTKAMAVVMKTTVTINTIPMITIEKPRAAGMTSTRASYHLG
jgi:hypothetical protein